MGFFESMIKKLTVSKASDEPQKIDRHAIPADKIDSAQRQPASAGYRKKICEKFYSDYPELPFISQDRELYIPDWEEHVQLFPNTTLVKREMMERYSDGLLPGHVYMLYWINKYDMNRRIPAYFEYEFGIDFVKEFKFLKKTGYIRNDNTASEKGIAALEEHYDLIKSRHPEPIFNGLSAIDIKPQLKTDRVFSSFDTEGLYEVPKEDYSILIEEFNYINSILDSVRKYCGVPQMLSVNVNYFSYELSHDETHYSWCPYTPSGKDSKYPLTLVFSYPYDENELTRSCFGELYYRKDGLIGKARLILWCEDSIGYSIYLGQTKNSLVVKKVEKSSVGSSIVLYKEN